jgi:hypothetical protein
MRESPIGFLQADVARIVVDARSFFSAGQERIAGTLAA